MWSIDLPVAIGHMASHRHGSMLQPKLFEGCLSPARPRANNCEWLTIATAVPNITMSCWIIQTSTSSSRIEQTSHELSRLDEPPQEECCIRARDSWQRYSGLHRRWDPVHTLKSPSLSKTTRFKHCWKNFSKAILCGYPREGIRHVSDRVYQQSKEQNAKSVVRCTTFTSPKFKKHESVHWTRGLCVFKFSRTFEWNKTRWEMNC